MQIDIIKNAIGYIEANLKTDITAGELAGEAGYSVYHFCRLFAEETGEAVKSYILGRRLRHAAYELASGRVAAEVALEYGFDTYAGFYKAFTREFGCSPRKYLVIYSVPVIPECREVNNMSLTKNEVREILKNWDIDQNLPIHDFMYMGKVKVAEDRWDIGDDYNLRVGMERRHQIKNIAVAKALASQGIGSALPVPTKTGEDYLDGETLTVLSKRVRGVSLTELGPFGENRLGYAAECGRAIGKLHKALLAVADEVQCDDMNLYAEVCEYAILGTKRENEQWALGLDEEFFEEYINEFGALHEKLPKQIIHRDPNPDNTLFEDGRVSGFVDFELSRIHARLFDPCYCSTGILCGASTAGEYERWLEILPALLRAYDEEIGTTDEEKRSVFYVICSIQMICVSYFGSIDTPDFRRLAKQNREMFKFVVKNRKLIEGIFA